MVYMNNWEDFSKAVQNLYELDSMNVGKNSTFLCFWLNFIQSNEFSSDSSANIE